MAVTIDSLPEEEVAGFYADSVFLRINGDVMDSHTIWDNVAIYLKALYRLEKHLRIENNRFKWDVKDGAELRITQNIFDYVIDRWEECNDLLETGCYEIEREMKSGRFYVVPKCIYITREKAYTPFFRKASRE
ncbi:hypothetical protein [Gabonibacter chumensis]|uniref:hypothetical protein n=1 Tax=Gabonibacter chumensis TaxID=2972474 RepID=UPI0025747D55|nr:hypothetical protein [Gabonibacter chumensis]MCR9012074.1 hypothetical protein [Gabonibacter chumensis]